MAEDTKNVFVSHIEEDDAGLVKLKDLLEDNGMTIRDYSISSDKSQQCPFRRLYQVANTCPSNTAMLDCCRICFSRDQRQRLCKLGNRIRAKGG